MFKKVCFKANFEGREGRAVTERERKRIPDWAAEKQKAQPKCCFLLKVWMRNILSSEEERRDLEGT